MSTTAIYVAFTIATVATVNVIIFTITTATFTITTAVSVASAVTAIFTVTAAVSVSSTSASDKSLHLVNSVRMWSYYLLAPFLQSVMSI
jgi:hypothetical protein